MEHDDVNDDDDGHNEDDNDDDDNDDGDVNEGFINICITLRMQDLTLPLTISWGLYKGLPTSVCTCKALFVASQNFSSLFSSFLEKVSV